MTKKDRQKFWEMIEKISSKNRMTKDNFGICPTPGIQEPCWPRASKNLCTPLLLETKIVEK